MTATSGYLSVADKTSQSIAANTWTPLTFNGLTRFDLPEGPTVLNAQLYGSPGSTRPKRILVRFQRYLPDGTTDPTAQEVYAIAPSGSWSCSATNLTFTEADTPIGVDLFSDAPLSLSTRIFKALNPSEYAARRLLPAQE